MHPYDIEAQARRLVNGPPSSSPRTPRKRDRTVSRRTAFARTLRKVADRLDDH